MLTEYLLEFALFGAEWVLWVLVILSIVNSVIILERMYFYYKHNLDLETLRQQFETALENASYKKAEELLEDRPSMEARVVLFGLQDRNRGPDAVQDRIEGALSTEKDRYDRFLSFLGTIGNNAPFIGLFGTVIGIIGAFANLEAGTAEASSAVMGAISEALVATGVGILVAIPAVIAFNLFKSRIKRSVAQTRLLGRTLLAHLRGDVGTTGE